MIIVMHPESTQFEIESVVAQVEARGWQTHLSNDHGQTIIGLQGNGQPLDLFQLGQLPGVRDVLSITQKFKVASRAFRPEDTTLKLVMLPWVVINWPLLPGHAAWKVVSSFWKPPMP